MNRSTMQLGAILVAVLACRLAAAIPAAAQSPEEMQDLAGVISQAQTEPEPPLSPLPPIPESDHPSVDELLAELTAAPGRDRVAEALVRCGRWRARLLEEMKRQQLPEDLLALVFVESRFKPKAVSKSDAGGFWQILPPTARLHVLRRDAFVDERFDPEAATRFAARYLHELYAQFGDWHLVLAAYNWGKGSVSRAIEAGAPRNFFQMRDKGRVRPETADYVPKILAARRLLADPAKFGFEPIRDADEKYSALVLLPLTDIPRLEMLAGVPGGTILQNNPALRTDYAPPDPGGYRVLVPEKYLAALDKANLGRNAVSDWNSLRKIKRVTVKVKKKTTLYSVGREYDTSLSSLRAWNNLAEDQVPAPGDEIVVYASDELK